ncbi:alkaline phosphatase family protein [Colletotrichum asianum]|uniref:Alkaline phosphatase family protein n=1 Tax=Colletotrichum asianum TaxID=702518 RepID=A0A8H3W7Z6_9PEZI|nr:alkaline phosphatase family protein [Colletotrichum asianum]
MALSSVLDSVAAITTLTLRITAVIFTRFHPLGRKYLNRIYDNFAIYVLYLIAKLATLSLSAVIQLLASFITVVLNLLSLGAVWDFLYRSHYLHQSNDISFSRVGYVDETSARIVAPEEDAEQPKSQVITVTDANDYTGTFLFEELKANTEYYYTTNARHAGSFKTAARDPKRWSLVSTSCTKPFYPYSPVDHGLRIKGLEYLDQYLMHKPVDMMLFLGDFIYIDLPIALGWTPEDYTSAYRQVYASPSWTPALRSLPWLHLYDDHEIINDWAANETGLYQSAMQPFWAYQGHANPSSQFGLGKTHYIFRRGDISFFVLDTRRYRSAESMDDGPGKTMLGPAQLADLQAWLASEKAWKVVVSSVPFTRNWRGPDSADSWSGYLHDREQVLDMMRLTEGVVILSGDRHEHATTIFPPGDKGGKAIIEFSTSPLNQFYEPFTRYHRQIEDTDVSVHSHPWGSSKFGVVSFDTSEDDRLVVDYDLVVQGQKTWNYTWTYQR